MPKKNEPTATQELTARYLAAGAGFKPEEQFKALIYTANHIALKTRHPEDQLREEFMEITEDLMTALDGWYLIQELPDDKAPF